MNSSVTTDNVTLPDVSLSSASEESNLLKRIRQFLPKIAAANAELSEKIEVGTEEEGAISVDVIDSDDEEENGDSSDDEVGRGKAEGNEHDTEEDNVHQVENAIWVIKSFKK